MFDLLIRNGRVIDGSGRPAQELDVAVQGDTLAAVEKIEGAKAAEVVDAAGRIVAPGFIDIHSHADQTLLVNPTADSLVLQGVTTAVVGQCGETLAPLLDGTRDQMIAFRSNETARLPWERWSTFRGFLDTLSASGSSVNVVPFVGQGTIRGSVMGFGAGRADRDQLARMEAEVEKAMDAGAFGLSSGLEYPPGSYAAVDELTAVARPAGRRGALYASHLRNEATHLLEAVDEAISVGRATGAAVEISHLKACWPAWDKLVPALERIDRARAEGLDVTFDVYPYLASSTTLTLVLPPWAQDGGREATLVRLADPAVRRRMAAEIREGEFGRPADWSKIMISRSPDPGHEGRFVAEMAEESGKEPENWVFDALRETGLEMKMVRFTMKEENLRLALRHPAGMIGSDSSALAAAGPLAQGKPHPRNFGTFPRVLGHYVREEKVLTLEEAVRKMTGAPAAKLHLADRGLVRKGFKADLVLLDPETIADRATYPSPFQYPVGIERVMVNGVTVARNGVHTRQCPGRVLVRN